jgi:hypothetical protein
VGGRGFEVSQGVWNNVFVLIESDHEPLYCHGNGFCCRRELAVRGRGRKAKNRFQSRNGAGRRLIEDGGEVEGRRSIGRVESAGAWLQEGRTRFQESEPGVRWAVVIKIGGSDGLFTTTFFVQGKGRRRRGVQMPGFGHDVGDEGVLVQ